MLRAVAGGLVTPDMTLSPTAVNAYWQWLRAMLRAVTGSPYPAAPPYLCVTVRSSNVTKYSAAEHSTIAAPALVLR